jgi:Anti-sigma-K factor rskA
MVDRILGAAPAAPPAPDQLADRRGSRHARAWTALVAVAAAFVLVVGGVVLTTDRTQPVAGTNWAQEVVHFDGAAGGTLAMAFVPGTPGAAFWGNDLPDPGEGMTYEIWMIDDGTPIPGGCVTPVDGRIAVFVNADVGTTEQMAVTVEPTDCPATPTSAPVLTAPLA